MSQLGPISRQASGGPHRAGPTEITRCRAALKPLAHHMAMRLPNSVAPHLAAPECEAHLSSTDPQLPILVAALVPDFKTTSPHIRTTMEPASLITLPPELLAEICRHLCRHCSRRHATDTWPWNLDVDDVRPGSPSADLLSLSRVCKTLRAVTEPFLYHSLATFHEYAVHFFLRDLMRHPDQPHMARRLSDVEVGHARWPNRPADLSSSESEDHDMFISMLLDLALNLRRAHFRLPSQSSSQLNLAKVPLTSLKALAFSSCDTSFPLDQATPLIMAAPNLEVLHCHGCTSARHWFTNSLGRIVLAPPPPLQNLTELTLSHARLDVASFYRLLSAVGPGLSKFSIQQQETTLDMRNEFVDFHEATAALAPWTDTLKELSYTIRGGALHQRPLGLPCMLHVREFTTLERLRVQLLEVVLVQMNIGHLDGYPDPEEEPLTMLLPNSLRELTLLGYRGSLASDLGELRDAKSERGRYAALRKIEIDARGFEKLYDPDSDEARELEQLGAWFQAEGVDFVFLCEVR